jgi:hypothetical protein
MLEQQHFQLAAGADEDAFLAADARAQVEVAYRQRGLLRRTTMRADDGEWLVATLWATREDADAAEPVIGALLPFIDASSLRVRRYEALPG